MTYQTVLLDPPWRFGNTASRAAAENHYPTLSIGQIAQLPLDQWAAPNSHCYLWTTDAHLKNALELMELWDFDFKQTLVWVKTTLGGKLNIGLGNYFRHAHELVLFGVRGKCPALVKNLPSVFWAARGSHSAKPDVLQEMIEQISPGPYLEIFARRARPNWQVWGNQAPAGELAE